MGKPRSHQHEGCTANPPAGISGGIRDHSVASAFSPTDTMPLTTRTKALMGLQATAALLTSLLVIARAFGALGGGR